eukprot:TRINITY_DN9202_c0_g2_i2.p1 TRINITY_DN9202_c0_g2~~TRINITY_DN9202_c0_g2_i2.p1  ORF type:complete len:320 (-),score=83.58 TRINITY_DN9202_c0_g2_i2:163-1122(-)
MAPKKSAGGYKAGSAPKAAAKAASAARDSPDVAWVKKQIGALQDQSSRGPDWLQEPHDWHCSQLEELVLRLESATVQLPESLRDDLADYVAQFDGQETDEDQFYIDRELYAEILAPLAPKAADEPYVRSETPAEAAKAVTALQHWDDASAKGIDGLEKLLRLHADCAEVQEAGLTKLGSLLALLRDGKLDKAAGSGLTAKTLTPMVTAAMKSFPQDRAVVRVGCSVLRAVVLLNGGVTVVADAGCCSLVAATIKTHLASMEVCKMGAAFFYAMVQKSEATSVERMAIKSTEAYQVLCEALSKYPTDLKYACEVTLPEIK